MPSIDSASDARIVNNTMRHKYRLLSEAEKASMTAIKDKGQELLALLDTLMTPPERASGGMAIVTVDRELNIARERIEEAVMWAVKHVTA